MLNLPRAKKRSALTFERLITRMAWHLGIDASAGGDVQDPLFLEEQGPSAETQHLQQPRATNQ